MRTHRPAKRPRATSRRKLRGLLVTTLATTALLLPGEAQSFELSMGVARTFNVASSATAMVADPTNDRIWIADGAAAEIRAYNATSLARVATITVPASITPPFGSPEAPYPVQPVDIAITRSGRVYAVATGVPQLLEIGGVNPIRVLSTVPLDFVPRAVAVDQATETVYVAGATEIAQIRYREVERASERVVLLGVTWVHHSELSDARIDDIAVHPRGTALLVKLTRETFYYEPGALHSYPIGPNGLLAATWIRQADHMAFAGSWLVTATNDSYRPRLRFFDAATMELASQSSAPVGGYSVQALAADPTPGGGLPHVHAVLGDGSYLVLAPHQRGGLYAPVYRRSREARSVVTGFPNGRAFVGTSTTRVFAITHFGIPYHAFRFSPAIAVADGTRDISAGMTFSALDIFRAGRVAPTRTTAPAPGTTLHRYLVARDTDADRATVGGLVAWHTDPDARQTSRSLLLRAYRTPVPIALVGINGLSVTAALAIGARDGGAVELMVPQARAGIPRPMSFWPPRDNGDAFLLRWSTASAVSEYEAPIVSSAFFQGWFVLPYAAEVPPWAG